MVDADDRRARRPLKTLSGVSSNPPPFRATLAVLTVQAGPQAGRVLPLAKEAPTTLGRADDCSIAFEDARLSRVHARIVFVAGDWMLMDEGSTNGTFVNGARVEKYSKLEDGDRILLGGSVSVRFVLVTEEERKSLTRVYEAAMRDGLTGVFNRKALDERLAAEIAFAVRHNAAISVVLLDVDNFKLVNDGYGHLAGDAVLREVAARLTGTLRVEDVLGRYGGEEFLVVARDISLEQGAQLAERLRALLTASPIVFEGTPIAVSASFGVASLACCGDRREVETLLGLADARLYEAKRNGRNRVVARGEATG
jgi:two-component system cell cycle response regulator